MFKSFARSGLALVAAFLAFVCLPATALAQSTEVYVLKVSLSGALQDDDSDGNPVIRRARIDGDDLVNLALGQPLGTPVGDTEILGLAVACNQMSLVVYDTATSTILLTIGTLDVKDTATNLRREVFMAEIDISTIGGGLNNIDDGELMFGGRATLDEFGCYTAVRANGMGVLGVVIDGEGFDLLVPRARLSSSGSADGKKKKK